MMNKSLIQEHLCKMGLGDYDITGISVDPSGDYVKANLPDLDFNYAFEIIMKDNKYYRLVLDDGELKVGKSLEFRITDIVDGFVTMYRLRLEKAIYGSDISALVKRIDYHSEVSGYMPVFSYNMLKDVRDRDDVDLDRKALLGTV